MGLIDMRTVFIIVVIINAVCTLQLSLSWNRENSSYKGIKFWVFDFFLHTLAQLLISLRGVIPDWISIVVANSMAILGAMLGYVAVAHFLNQKVNKKLNIALMLSFVPMYSYFTFISPSLEARHLIGSFFWLVMNLRILYVMIFKADRSTMSFTKPLIYAYGVIGIVNSSRIVKYFVIRSSENDYFQSGIFEKIVPIMILVMFVILTYSIVLAINKRLLEDMNKQEKKYNHIFASSPNAIMISSLRDGKIIEVNDGFVEMFKFQGEDLIGKTTQELRVWLRKEDRKRFIREIKDTGRVRNLEMNLRKKTDEIMTGLLSADIIEIDGENVILSVTNDISIRKAMEEKIVDMSNRDSLTNAYNRRYVFSRLETMLKEHKKSDQGFSISMLDIDYFKKVNDEYGHQAGDLVLTELTKLIDSNIRDCDFLGRYGGEEFIVISSCIDKNQAANIMGRILQKARETIVIHYNREIAYTFSCGISDTFEFEKDSLDIETIIKQADERLYQAKNDGRNQIKI